MTEKPQQTCNRAELAEMLGCSLPTIDAYVRKGMPFIHRGSRGREWQFDLAAVLSWRLDQIDAEKATTTAIDAHRARLLKAQADKAELDAGLHNGSLVSLNDAREATIPGILRCKQKLLGIGAKIGPALADEPDVAKCEAIIRAALEEALAELPDLANLKFGNKARG